MMKRTKILAIVLASAALFLCLGYAGLRVFMGQAFCNPVLAVLPVPGLPDAEVWLLQQGFVDRDITLFVRSLSRSNGKAVKIAVLDWDGQYYFSRLQWSRDGQFAVFAVQFAGGNGSEVNAFAYDFSDMLAVLPTWYGQTAISGKVLAEWWQEHEKMIAALGEGHGGMSSDVLARQDCLEHGRKLWYWQVPK